jgi:hypothetical protein
MPKNRSIQLFLGFSAFFFCCSIALLFYTTFFSAVSGWEPVINQLLKALAVVILMSSFMVMTAISSSRTALKQNQK